MSNILLVPIHLDALVLNQETTVLDAMADFRGLPYSNTRRDFHTDMPYLSEEIVPQPWQNENLRLKPGIHLHWALPDALTQGKDTAQGSRFPQVPNRWLVTRTNSSGVLEKQWIVESDYLYPEGTEDGSGSVNVIVRPQPNEEKFQPFRYLGRKQLLPDWQEDPTADRFAPLTAVGYGHPAFAAFYPNCHSVFGFFDPDYVGQSIKDLRYTVIGWYADPQQDYLGEFIRGIGQQNTSAENPNNADILSALQSEFQWTVSIGDDIDFPQRMVPYAQTVFTVAARSASLSPRNTSEVAVTVGNTGTEALSAYLARVIDVDYAETFEKQLEALQMASRLEHRQLDIGPKFNEARHEQGFSAVAGGWIWTIRPQIQTPGPANTNDAQPATRLPAAMADQLNALNILQETYDRASHEIGSLQQRLFTDWYKYMLSVYPPTYDPQDYPDLDQLRYFIIREDLQPLEAKILATGTLQPDPNHAGRWIGQPDDSLAGNLAVQLNALVDDIATYNQKGITVQLPLKAIDGNQVENRANAENPGRLSGAPVIAEDPIRGSVLRLNGSSQAITLNDPLATNEAFSFALWVNPSQLDTGEKQGLWGLAGAEGQRKPSLWVAAEQKGLDYRCYDAVNQQEYAGQLNDFFVGPNEWVHVAWVKVGERFEFYRNGQLFPTPVPIVAPIAFETDQAQPYFIGQVDTFFSGDLSDVRISTIALSAEQIHQIMLDTQIIYQLKNVASPRFWQPNNPVVLLSGDEVKPTERHGQDGRFHSQGYLETQLLTSSEDPIPEQFSTILAKIQEIRDQNPSDNPAFRQWSQQPWNPFLLDWEVEVLPLREQSNAHPDRHGYASNFIMHNYQLPENEPELQLKNSQAPLVRAASFYRGSNLLTAHAREQMEGNLERHMTQRLLPRYYADNDIPPDQQTPDYLREHIAEIRSWYEKQPDFPLNSPEDQAKDTMYTALRAYESLPQVNVLSQALDGFNQALLMHHQTLQLNIQDPLAFDQQQDFIQRVKAAVAESTRLAPAPLNDFNPIRSGIMKIEKLRLVDTFGVFRDLSVSGIQTAQPLSHPDPDNPNTVALPPRLVPPSRLMFRWLSADGGEQEANDHPATSPICGWVLPNYLDNSLFIYQPSGDPLGIIDQRAEWRSVPGNEAVFLPEQIPNPYLQQWVRYLLRQDSEFLSAFLTALETGLQNIEPENFAQHQGLSLLMGRPLALVRTFLNLDVQGLPVVPHSWPALRGDMQRTQRDIQEFHRVEFPIRLGEYQQFNDGLIGYWKEVDADYEDEIFYAPQSAAIDHPKIRTHAEGVLTIERTLEDRPKCLTMLVDPRGKVHATSGILPTKAIDIPLDHYRDALQNIEVTFLTAPILNEPDSLKLHLPAEPGYQWAWVSRTKTEWSETTEIGQPSTQADFAIAPEIQEGWVRLRKGQRRRGAEG